jgi:hypothetical protein
MMFELGIRTDATTVNEHPTYGELAHMLRDVANQLEAGKKNGTCRNFDGHIVGTWALTK